MISYLDQPAIIPLAVEDVGVQRNTLRLLKMHNTHRGGELLINELAVVCRRAADTWYYDPHTGERIFHNKGERLMLMVSELAEAFEGARKDKMDDHLPHRPNIEVELADCMIRILDFAGEYSLDIGGAFWEKIGYNLRRQDHKAEQRALPGGKKF